MWREKRKMNQDISWGTAHESVFFGGIWYTYNQTRGSSSSSSSSSGTNGDSRRGRL